MGGNSQTWSNLVTVWGSVSAISGRESYQIGGLKDQVKYKIITRSRFDLDSGSSEITFDSTYNFLLRALYRGRYFNIEYARDRNEDRAYTELIAVEDMNAIQ